MKIAAYQFAVSSDVSKNLEIIEQAIIKAGKNGVELLVFPECALTGYPPRDIKSSSEVEFDLLKQEYDFGERGRREITDELLTNQRADLTTVFFVRHAQSLHPWEDDRTRPLTEEGLSDRSLVLDTIKGRQIDVFLSSPYKRSVDTIKPAADFFGMPIITDERFRERKNGEYGKVTGLLARRWSDFDYAEEGGESLRSTQDRNISALFDALDRYAGKSIVIGTHGTALSTILNYYEPSFCVDDFLRIVDWMPYIIELTFAGHDLIRKKELGHVCKE